jgi:hypothetical protein
MPELDNRTPKSGSGRWQGLPFPLQMVLGVLFLCALLLLVPALLRGLGKARWIIAVLLLLAPLIAAIVDMIAGRVRPSVRNVVVVYLGYASRAFFVLGVQFVAIAVLFLVGPVWLFASLLTLVDIVTRFIPRISNPSVPVLCDWIGIGHPYCVPALVVYHLMSAVLAYVVYRFGSRLLDVPAAWYHRFADSLAGQLRP